MGHENPGNAVPPPLAAALPLEEEALSWTHEPAGAGTLVLTYRQPAPTLQREKELKLARDKFAKLDAERVKNQGALQTGIDEQERLIEEIGSLNKKLESKRKKVTN